MDTRPIAENHRFLFIGGLHRSGTSLVFKLLREHPLISGFTNTGVPEDEGQHLQNVLPTGRDMGRPGVFGFHRDAHLTEGSKFASLFHAERLVKAWAPLWDLGCPVLLEKSPPNLLRGRLFQELFPGSFMIFVVRHPIPVALSTKKWRSHPLYRLMRHWVHCHRLVMDDLPFLRNVLVIRYEQFVREPQKYMDIIYAALGLPSMPVALSIDLNTDRKYFESWKRLHRDWPTAAYAPVLERRYEQAIGGFGYSFSPPYYRNATSWPSPPRARLDRSAHYQMRLENDEDARDG